MPTRIILTVLFVATIVAANMALARWGMVPVGFGLEAPAGVYFAGLALGLRDALQEHAGSRWRVWVLGAIAAGALVTLLIEDTVTIPGGLVPIAVASATAFALSELLDLSIYTPLRDRSWPAAVAASNLAGAFLDSVVFLWLAFGSVTGRVLAGQMVGKALMVLPALVLVGWLRHRRDAREVEDAWGVAFP